MSLETAQEIVNSSEESFRGQQLALCMLDRLVHIFGRHHRDQQPAIIVDPFAGTGSTGVAARANACHFVGIDKDDDTGLVYKSWATRPPQHHTFGEQLNTGKGKEADSDDDEEGKQEGEEA